MKLLLLSFLILFITLGCYSAQVLKEYDSFNDEYRIVLKDNILEQNNSLSPKSTFDLSYMPDEELIAGEIEYRASDWLFIDDITFKINDRLYEVEILDYKRDVLSGSMIVEKLYFVFPNILMDSIYTYSSTIRLHGDNGYVDRYSVLKNRIKYGEFIELMNKK